MSLYGLPLLLHDLVGAAARERPLERRVHHQLAEMLGRAIQPGRRFSAQDAVARRARASQRLQRRHNRLALVGADQLATLAERTLDVRDDRVGPVPGFDE